MTMHDHDDSDWEPKPIADAETLYDVAHARAGNKQDISNVSVIPYDDDVYDELVDVVTAERVKAHFAGIVTGEVERYCVPSVSAMNFVMYGALDGGWTQSNRIDRSGKTLSQFMLRLPLDG